MLPELNPFTPGSGLKPPALKGREAEIEIFDRIVARSKTRKYDRGMVLSGLRGVGKTALLNHLAENAERHGWLVIRIEGRPDNSGVATVRKKLGRELAQGLRRFSRRHHTQQALDTLIVLASRFTLSVGIAGAKIDLSVDDDRAASGDIEVDLEELVEDVCEAVRKKNSAFGLFIDEMQDLDAELLAALLAVQHRAGQHGWPFFVIGAGLPNLSAKLAGTRSYSERLFDYRVIGPLAEPAAREALDVPVTRHGCAFEPEALNILVAGSAGYPYFIQVFGKEIWNLAEEKKFTDTDAHEAVELGRLALDSGFFPSRWERASPGERDYLRAIAATGEDTPRTGELAGRLGVQVSALSGVRDTAIKKGLVWSPEYGRVAFTVPGMADFIRRQPV